MDSSLYGKQESGQKVKFIVVTAIVTIALLGIAVWAIISIVNNHNKTAEVVGQTTSQVAEQNAGEKTADNTSTEQPAADVTSSTEGVSTSQPATGFGGNANEAAPVAVNSDNIPQTGPEELLPLALVLGTGAAFVTSRKMARA